MPRHHGDSIMTMAKRLAIKPRFCDFMCDLVHTAPARCCLDASSDMLPSEAAENRDNRSSRDALRRKRLAGADPGTHLGGGNPDLRATSPFLRLSVRAHPLPAASSSRIGVQRARVP